MAEVFFFFKDQNTSICRILSKCYIIYIFWYDVLPSQKVCGAELILVADTVAKNGKVASLQLSQRRLKSTFKNKKKENHTFLNPGFETKSVWSSIFIFYPTYSVLFDV